MPRLPCAPSPARKRKIAVTLTALVIMCAVGLVLAFVLRSPVRKSLTLEAGAPLPQAAAFIIANGRAGRIVSGLPGDSTQPGEYPLTIVVGKRNCRATLIVRDTVPPVGRGAQARIWAGAELKPAALVSEVYDVTQISYAFEQAPDTSRLGRQQVAVLLTDAGGNITRLPAELFVYDTLAKLELEPGADLSLLSALDFIINASAAEAALFTLETQLSALDANVPGQHDIALLLGDQVRLSVLDILDITPPQASPLQVRKFTGDTLEPEEFVTDIIDESPVSASFAREPDNTLEGRQDVLILLTDSYGNSTELTAVLTLVLDSEAPLIEGMLDKTVFVGDTIAYRAGITVSDNRDAQVALEIDAAEVDLKTAGKYPVTYSATDSSGNTAVARGSVTVLDISREQVEELAGQVLAGLIKDGMSACEQASAIYKWVRNNVGYVNSSVKDDLTVGAYRALKDHRGDCFVFAAISDLLLTRAGIDNVLLQRTAGARHSAHYWSLVNTGAGWYHFDTTPHLNGGDCFMLSESQVQELAKKRGRNYYDYDHSLYPEAVQ